MSRTLCCMAVISLASLGAILAAPGLSPRASALSLLERTAQQTSLELRALPADAAEASDGAKISVRARLASDPGFGPAAGDLEPRGRPKSRTFWARGPLVARVSDAGFGPKIRPDDLLVPDPPPRLAGAGDLLCIAVAVYHEARDQSLDGQLAVASVILNRTRAPKRWGSSPCEVVVPGQFSFLSSDGSYPPIEERDAWAVAVEMAREALERGPSPVVGQADHYHTPAVEPAWNDAMEQVIRINDHIFFVDPMTQG